MLEILKMNKFVIVGSGLIGGWWLIPVFKRNLIELYKLWSMSSSVELVSNGVGMIRYTFRGKAYKLFIPLRRGPSRIRSVRNENFENVTDDILSYMGPSNNFVTTVCVTPVLMGYKELHFTLVNGGEKSFFGEEPIKLF